MTKIKLLRGTMGTVQGYKELLFVKQKQIKALQK